jgi:hypothetical protein
MCSNTIFLAPVCIKSDRIKVQVPYNIMAIFKLAAIVPHELCGDSPAKLVSGRSASNQGWMSPGAINYLQRSSFAYGVED